MKREFVRERNANVEFNPSVLFRGEYECDGPTLAQELEEHVWSSLGRAFTNYSMSCRFNPRVSLNIKIVQSHAMEARRKPRWRQWKGNALSREKKKQKPRRSRTPPAKVSKIQLTSCLRHVQPRARVPAPPPLIYFYFITTILYYGALIFLTRGGMGRTSAGKYAASPSKGSP